MIKTTAAFDEVITNCFEIYKKKLEDYGAAWQILRISSLTDQIFIKAQRIRNIQLSGKQKVEDSIRLDFIGILNYSVIALIQLKNQNRKDKITIDEAIKRYHNVTKEAKELLRCKNHDYGEAWKQMRQSSLTDLILMKINRIKQIEDNNSKNNTTEGISDNFFDIINYAVFALINFDKS